MSQNNGCGAERLLVRQAAVSPMVRKQLQKELTPYVARATKTFMQLRGIPKEREGELIKVGMSPFDQVFNIYLRNAGDRYEEEGHFYKYYIWWMRQAIVEHLRRHP
jgi:hypothetical protein